MLQLHPMSGYPRDYKGSEETPLYLDIRTVICFLILLSIVYRVGSTSSIFHVMKEVCKNNIRLRSQVHNSYIIVSYQRTEGDNNASPV